MPKSRRHGARYRARRRAADIMYEAENRDVDPVAIVEDRIKLARENEHDVAPIAEYTKVLVTGVAEELDTIDTTIERFLSEDWELHRIPAVDRAIMRVAVWELLFNPEEIDLATAVTEGVELASEYSTDAAAPYINAVLDDVAHFRSEDNPMNADISAEDSEDEAESDVDATEDSTDDQAADVAEEIVAEAAPEAENTELSEMSEKPGENQ
ncbi:MAG: transcription antitermination factor NusB [Corynebacterium casei]|nr:transcription antitermination factor NusB [Corynebacterium casei]MDN5705761.1 transcription antitermination factor NusB [Corynebacterium casei]MDN5728220.1 transcription antitermination factor NusB [Corynebacterium casei]MDN5739993.1 transcription antitermination factor NusB [Corynebacterium casei]MDN5799640.1 transcription antitermination factor NusB [Corynebacterium casei]MDN5825571.1 transcription antitermination factor NusB [Corynebacterium casei]